jgi:FixJ family two-component response regulator
MSERKPSVLIVDDRPNWRSILADLLGNKYNITAVGSYLDAQEAVRKQKPPFHVTITDIRLDDNDVANEQGLDFLASLKEQRIGTKSIVVTGHATVPTAKRALKDLQVFDYIEKTPDGSQFNKDEFREIVHEATQAAIQERAQTVLPGNTRLLVVADEQHWRDALVTILKDDNYTVDKCANLDDLIGILQDHTYSLIILNANLLANNPTLPYQLHKHQQGVQILLAATATQVPLALEAVREQNVYGIVLIGDDFDVLQFRQMVRNAMAPAIQWYVVAHFEDAQAEKYMLLNQTYNVIVSVQSESDPHGVVIRRLARSATIATIRIAIYAQDMDIGSKEDIYWKIPFKTQPTPQKVAVTPRYIGKKVISLDFEEGDRWLGRWNRVIQVVGSLDFEEGEKLLGQ